MYNQYLNRLCTRVMTLSQVAPRPTEILKYPDRQTDDLLRLLMVEHESTCVRVLILVRGTALILLMRLLVSDEPIVHPN